MLSTYEFGDFVTQVCKIQVKSQIRALDDALEKKQEIRVMGLMTLNPEGEKTLVE